MSGLPENKTRSCLLHTNVFAVAKQFKKLCLNDQKMLFQFVDSFFPPNHLLYFLMREILQTGSKTTIDDGMDDRQTPPDPGDINNNVTIHSVRDYSGYAAAFMPSPRHPTRGIRPATTPSSWSFSSSDGLSDSEDNTLSEKKSPVKINTTRRHPHKRPASKKRNIYRLLNSTSVNAIERHYERALNNELIYMHTCHTTISHNGHHSSGPLFVHHCHGIRGNHIAGNTAETTARWHCRADARIKSKIQYTIAYPENREESAELSIHPPDDYHLRLQFSPHWHPADKRMASITYLRDRVDHRADLVARFIRQHERYMDKLPHPVPTRQEKTPGGSPYQDDSDPPEPLSPSQRAIPHRAVNTTARRFGVMHLLPKEIRKKNRHLYAFDELCEVTDYLINTASIKITKLIDFALLSARDTWALLNSIMDHAIDLYSDYHRYPVQDSLTSILLYDTEKTDKRSTDDHENRLNIDRYALLWQNGDSTKMGDIITFVQSYRRLMRTILSTCCCYFMDRRAANTRSFIEKHHCLLPKATQGVYFSMFLRIRAGHELLCLSQINTATDAFVWLEKFNRLRDTLWRKQRVPYTDKLHNHLGLRATPPVSPPRPYYPATSMSSSTDARKRDLEKKSRRFSPAPADSSSDEDSDSDRGDY